MVLLESNLYIARKNEDVKFPTKREEDGCYDLYAYFNYHNNDYLDIEPGEIVPVPTGIHTALTPHHRISIRERSSNIKWGGLVVAGQIDSGYRGEIFVAIYNSNRDKTIRISKEVDKIKETTLLTNGRDKDFILVPYNKAIAQFAVENVPLIKPVEISVEELMKIPSDRGAGALGSSNK